MSTDVVRMLQKAPTLAAAIEFLSRAFVADDGLRAVPEISEVIAMCERVLVEQGARGRGLFIDSVLFALRDPSDYRWLRKLILAVVPAEALVVVVAERIRSGDATTVRNAVALTYHVLLRDVELAPSAFEDIHRAQEERARDTSLPAAVRESLAELRLPVTLG